MRQVGNRSCNRTSSKKISMKWKCNIISEHNKGEKEEKEKEIKLMGILKCPGISYVTLVSRKISISRIERNYRKKIENLSNRLVETADYIHCRYYPAYYSRQWDCSFFSVIPCRNEGEKWI